MAKPTRIPAMIGKDAAGDFPWRDGDQIRGVRSQLQKAINLCSDGASVEVDIKTAMNLIEVCRQAAYTEDAIYSGIEMS